MAEAGRFLTECEVAGESRLVYTHAVHGSFLLCR